jgi:hypothetical protein
VMWFSQSFVLPVMDAVFEILSLIFHGPIVCLTFTLLERKTPCMAELRVLVV